ncbi:ubiquitin carboxyl-terminal hydrolase 28-like [Pteronotus mesoamericanus]|uniref:ubiquitin carboxyl-terminal hydrolase 28-like n=1 Tax=Pteronotus mesoamericanus TaxID=1884717 RepID=UPI0023ECFCCF|nr:ubiquitin carboxyl-terminal hydrolase 28-like [Pteronotus parnellii mesoamericanus]
MLQRKQAASKSTFRNKIKEGLSALNSGDRRPVTRRSIPWCPVRLGWRLSATSAELQRDEVAAADRHDASCQRMLSQPSEVTDVRDSSCLRRGLKARDGDAPLAGSLASSRAKEPSLGTGVTEPPEVRESAVNRRALAKVIGFTPESKEEVQAAIALSLLKSPKVQAGGRTLRRHEAISAESKRSKRKHCEVWGENFNPNDWRRVDGWPVGLKNVGNTCWFSAVIQSLFQLPELRRLVLGYSLPQDAFENCPSHKEKRNIMFMQELQRLFALMMGSNRRFVDPSAALNLLKGAFQSTEEQQQDVSEFTHKLLDWLEDAFQLTVQADSGPRDNSKNPMVQLFYGTVLTEGVREGKPFSNSETFGQYPLQVNGYCNLDECLEGAMVETDIELLPSSHPVKYGQERWFTKLPPVLTFELSRFEFNQSLGQPEKIHNKLEFPQVIYMDRYMHRNKDLVQSKRERIRQLKEEVRVLQQRLESCVKYDLSPAPFPLVDVTSQSDTNVTLPLSSATSKESSLDIAGIFSEDSLSKSPPEKKPLTSSWPSGEMPATPAPQTATDEINFVKTRLQRRSSEIERDIEDLKNSIASTIQSIKQMYCDPLLSQVPYRLHAVLVHEGQANAGHYWVYIYNQPRQVWLKYNDISVTESSWEELESDSYGGLKNASAYCLMYIKDKLSLFDAEAGEGGPEPMPGDLEVLSAELQHYVQEDNRKFEREIEEWEEERSRKMTQMESSASSLSRDFSPSQQHPVASYGVRGLPSGPVTIVREPTAQAAAATTRAYGKSGVGAVWGEAFHEKYSRLY